MRESNTGLGDSTFIAIITVFLSAILAACSPASKPAVSAAPPTPEMPAHWRIVSDIDFGRSDIQPVSASFGANVRALRNTTYDVAGLRVKLNTIVAASEADARVIVMSLGKMKPAEFFVQRGLVVYEFVGPNAAMEEMRLARKRLTSP